MEQRIVAQESNRYIYFIQDGDVRFYLAIPKMANVSLLLNLIDGIDDIKVKQDSVFNRVVISPVIGREVLDGLLQNKVSDYQKVDDIFSKAINDSYQILTYNHIAVERSVSLNENRTYSMFCQWFCQKYNGRVQLIPYKQEMVESVTPVVNQVTDSNLDVVSENIEEAVPVVQSKGGLGFVSYVLLGVVVAVVSLVFLYFML